MRSQICFFLRWRLIVCIILRDRVGAVEASLSCEFEEGTKATEFIGDVVGETSVYHTKETIIIESVCNWKAKVQVYVGKEEGALMLNKFWGI